MFIYEDDRSTVYVEDPLGDLPHRRSFDEHQAIHTTEAVVEEWSLWLDILETAAVVPTLREQLDAAIVTYHLTKDA